MNNNDLREDSFKISKQTNRLHDNYLDILNTLIKEAKKQGVKPKDLIKASGLSKGTISFFLNNLKEDHYLLQDYAGILGYELTLQINKISTIDILKR